MLTEPDRLPGSLREALEEESSEVLVSAVVTWEIAIKHAVGKLPLPSSPRDFVPLHMGRSGSTEVPITHADTLDAVALPLHHGDPFDRLLIAQARRRKLPIASRDPVFDDYDVEVAWEEL